MSNHESGLDVDKLDYLSDSKQSNVEVGSKFEYLLKCARVQSADGHIRISFPDKAYMNVLKVFQCRYEMHQPRTRTHRQEDLLWAIAAAAPFLT